MCGQLLIVNGNKGQRPAGSMKIVKQSKTYYKILKKKNK